MVTSGHGLGALESVRVADFSRVLAGPYATMLLADLGADVIKVEGLHGDDTRSWRPPADANGQSTYFASVNRNKRSIALDLKGDGLETALRLASTADVLIENMRPGAMERLGLGYEELRERNPGLVYCSISGFGEREGAELPGYDLLVQAVGGLMSVTGEPDGRPMKTGVALVDVVTGLHACVGIQSALLERQHSGLGQRVTVSLLSSLLSALVNQSSSAVLTGVTPRAVGNAHPSIAPYETFRAADRDLVIAVGNDRQFASLARLLGSVEWTSDPRFARNESRVAHRHALQRLIENKLAHAPAHHWADRCMAEGIPAGVVNTIPEALGFASSLGLDPVARLQDGGDPTVRNPIGLSRTPPTHRLRPPALTADNPAIDWLRTSHPEIERTP